MLEAFQQAMAGTLPGLFRLELSAVEAGRVAARMAVREEYLAPNGFLHAAAVIAIADSCCGVGCAASLPDGAAGFTTIELKANFLRSARAGQVLRCEARLVHGGRRTQVWDASVVRDDDSADLALFRCTQYLIQAGDFPDPESRGESG